MTSVIHRGELHLPGTMKKTHFSLVETYHDMCKDEDTDECMSDFNQEVTLSCPEREYTDTDNTDITSVQSLKPSPSSLSSSSSSSTIFFPQNFLYTNNTFQNGQLPTEPHGNIPFSVYEQTNQEIADAKPVLQTGSQLVSTNHNTERTLLNQSNYSQNMKPTNNHYANGYSSIPPPPYSTTTSTRSPATVSPSTQTSVSIPRHSSSLSFPSVMPSLSSPLFTTSSSAFSTVQQQQPASFIHSVTTPYTSPLSSSSLPSSFQSSTTLAATTSSPRQMFSSPCLTPPPQRSSNEYLRPNSCRSHSFSSLPSSIQSASSLSSTHSLSSEIPNKPRPQFQTPTPLSSFTPYNQPQHNQFNNSIQNNQQTISGTFISDNNNNFLKREAPSFVNQEETVHYTDLGLDTFGEISFYDELTSGNFKDLKQEPIDQSPVITSSTVMAAEEPVSLEYVVEAMWNDLERDRQFLKIDNDPHFWTKGDVAKWVKFVCDKSRVTDISDQLRDFNGAVLYSWPLDRFESQFGASGATVFQELDLWTTANNIASSSLPDSILTPSISPTPSFHSNHSQDSMFVSMDNSTDDGFHSDIEMNDDQEPSNSDTKLNPNSSDEEIGLLAMKNHRTRLGRGHKKAITLWQFILQLLIGKDDRTDCIRWLNREKRIFKIEDSKKVAALWGKVKNRPAMNYDKLSRSIRQYYKKKIIQKPEQTKRLVYQFCPGIC